MKTKTSIMQRIYLSTMSCKKTRLSKIQDKLTFTSVVPLPSKMKIGFLRLFGEYDGRNIPDYAKFVNIMDSNSKIFDLRSVTFGQFLWIINEQLLRRTAKEIIYSGDVKSCRRGRQVRVRSDGQDKVV
ncbi:uncharacterized protein LOC118433248 [Folsomia candida]|uniref:uncharacterized protein LOC118433248 n=1 Tax=Folsomia candida TaxID=158441 RepID=UPI001604CE07|nr:uncharacterized protein LOC118433248 [Folsomia candida]